MASPLGRRYALAAAVAGFILAGCAGSSTPSAKVGTALTSARKASDSGYYCPAVSGGTGLLSDGDFSQALQPGGNGDATYKKGAVFAPSWHVSTGNIDFLSTGYWNMDGLCSVDLDGDLRVGGVQTKSFATQRGAQYTVSFLLSGNGDCAPTVKSMKLTVKGTHQHALYTWDTSNGNNVRNGDYASESWSFVAPPMTSVKFHSNDPVGSGCGAVIAGVSVTKN